MKLYIDTHSKILTIALLNNETLIIKKNIDCDNKLSTLTINSIKKTLEEINVNKKDIKEIIVVNGPGSFTGIRIGVTIAKTWAFSLNIKIKAVDFLYLSALSVDSSNKKIVSVKDPKGYYLGYFNEDNIKLEDYVYIKEKDLESYLNTHEGQFYNEIENIDFLKLIKNIDKIKNVTAHEVNPLYIKRIEVENGKRS